MMPEVRIPLSKTLNWFQFLSTRSLVCMFMVMGRGLVSLQGWKQKIILLSDEKMFLLLFIFQGILNIHFINFSAPLVLIPQVPFMFLLVDILTFFILRTLLKVWLSQGPWAMIFSRNQAIQKKGGNFCLSMHRINPLVKSHREDNA